MFPHQPSSDLGLPRQTEFCTMILVVNLTSDARPAATRSINSGLGHALCSDRSWLPLVQTQPRVRIILCWVNPSSIAWVSFSSMQSTMNSYCKGLIEVVFEFEPAAISEIISSLILRLYFLVLVWRWVLLCLFMLPLSTKPFPQMSHLNFLIPRCIFLCRVRWLRPDKTLPQMSHLNPLPRLWTFWCSFK